MIQYPVLAEESPLLDGTFADGSFTRRLRELVLDMESLALAYGFTRVRKPQVAVMLTCPGRGPHLHAGFLAVTVDAEPS